MNIRNCFTVLRLCERHPRTENELREACKISRATFFRTLRDLENRLGARVVLRDGRYEVARWGVINRRALMGSVYG